MKSKLLFFVTWIALVCTVFFFIMDWFMPETFDTILITASSVFNLCGVGLLLDNATFKKSTFYRWTSLSISFIFIGMLFKIMHWPWGAQIIILAFTSLGLLYFLHFLKKADKGLLSVIKLLFVFTFCISRFFVFLHLPYNEILELVPILILACAVFLFTFPPANSETPNVLD